MKKERFDYVCSLGSSCLCAQSLGAAGLRLSSGPFDWLLGPSLGKRVDVIVGDFAGWLEPGDFKFLGNPNKFTHDSYLNTRTEFKFPHDFALNVPFEKSWPEVREKYLRRIARFYERIRASHRVLFVWLENPVAPDRPSDEEVRRSVEVLAAKFPGVKIELLVVDRAPDDESTGAFKRGDGYWRISCGYRKRSTEPGKDVRPWDIDTHPIERVLAFFETADNRSAEERRRHRAADRAQKYSIYGAKGAFGYALARIQVRICKLLLNRLRRRGASMRRLFEVQFEGWR